MKSLTNRIKAKAKDLGFDKIGITKAEITENEKQNLDLWIEKNYHAPMH